VHIDVANTLNGRALRYSDDDGLNAGIQRITVNGTMHATVRVVAGATYFRADRAALTGYFQFPAAVAERAADRWLLLQNGDPGYDQVTEGVTFSSAMNELALAEPLVLLPARVIHGKRVIGIRGLPAAPPGATGAADVTATATLWVAASGDPLPVSYEAHVPQLGTMTATFSKWGHGVAVSAPSPAATMADVLAGRG
jgi:hypothetical protein